MRLNSYLFILPAVPVLLFCSVASSPGPPTPPPPSKKYPPNLKNGHRGAKFPFSECQNYTDKSISQIPPGGSKLGGGGTWSKPADPGMEIICVAEMVKTEI